MIPSLHFCPIQLCSSLLWSILFPSTTLIIFGFFLRILMSFAYPLSLFLFLCSSLSPLFSVSFAAPSLCLCLYLSFSLSLSLLLSFSVPPFLCLFRCSSLSVSLCLFLILSSSFSSRSFLSFLRYRALRMDL